MMKLSGGVISCCVVLLFALTSVSAGQKKLKSIQALKKVNFGQSVSKHSLLLLHWFANTVDIDNNNIIWLTFDPNRRDYGSHYYGNYEELLDPLPSGNEYQYYTIGNLNEELSTQLPHYVVNPPSEYEGSNGDRIIFRVREQNTGRQALQRIDQVYMTQHYDTYEHQGTSYDQDHTYRITMNLLRQIREFSLGQNQQQQLQLRNRFGSNANLRHIRNTWAGLACLGLLLFIVIQEKNSSNQPNNRPETRRNHQNAAVRDNRNQGDVMTMMYLGEVDDHVARRTTPHYTPVTQNNDRRSCRRICCIVCCCITVACVIAFSIILYFWYNGSFHRG